jgi:hypothetical protein
MSCFFNFTHHFGDSKHIFTFKIVHGFPEKIGLKHCREFMILLCYQAVFLTFCFIFYFKTSFMRNVPFVNKKGYVLEILSIFLNLKSFTGFPRKMFSNIAFSKKKAYALAMLSIFLNLKSYKYFPRKTSLNLTQKLCSATCFSNTELIIYHFPQSLCSVITLSPVH